MSCNFCKNISFLALGLRIYCKFCPMDTRSQEPEPKLEYSHKPVKTFHARARAMATKNPRISAIDTMKKVPEVFPEYKYKDVFYGGSSSRNSNENPWQKETNYDSRSISSTYNGKWILNAIWSIPTQSPRNPHAIHTQFPRNPHAIPTQFPRNPHAIHTQSTRPFTSGRDKMADKFKMAGANGPGGRLAKNIQFAIPELRWRPGNSDVGNASRDYF